MSKIRPIKPNHSINEVVFVVTFSQPLSEKNLQMLLQLEDILKEKLPKMDSHQGAEIRVNSKGQIEPQVSKLSSLTFKRLNIKNELEWLLRIEGNFIAVNCLDYDRWKNIWPMAHEYLKLASQKLISPENPIETLALQYIDRFIFDDQVELYKTSTIFDNESEYLNKKVTKAGPFWHIHQGWFDNTKEFNLRILNRLNITAAMADKEHHTTIDHSATILFKKKITNHKTLFEKSNKGKIAIDYYFDLLHIDNKRVLKDLLNNERLDDIKLT